MGVPISTEADRNDQGAETTSGPQDLIRKGLIKISNIPKIVNRGKEEMHRTNIEDEASGNHIRPGHLHGRDKSGEWSTSSESLQDLKAKKANSKRARTITARPRTATLRRPAVLNMSIAKTVDMSETNSRALLTSGKVSAMSFVRSDWYLNAGYNQRSTPPLVHERANSLPRQRPSRRVFGRGASSDDGLISSPESDPNTLEPRCNTAVKSTSSVLQYFPHKPAPVSSTLTDDPLNGLGRINKLRARPRSKTKQKRPKTIKLSKPTANLAIPHIGTASYLNKNKYPPRKPAALIVGPPDNNIPEPCTTCGRPDHPERFHSHPAHTRGLHAHKTHHVHGKIHHHHEANGKKIKDKGGGDSDPESPHRKPTRSVNKPLALKYHRKPEIRMAIQQKQKEKDLTTENGEAFILIASTQQRKNGVDENSNNLSPPPAKEKRRNSRQENRTKPNTDRASDRDSPHQSDSSIATSTSSSSKEHKKTIARPGAKNDGHNQTHGHTRIDNGTVRLPKRQSTKTKPPFRTVFTDDDASEDDKSSTKSPEAVEAKKDTKDNSSLITISLTDDLQNLNPGPPRVSTSVGARPNSFVCYFCGREYGSRSLPIHAEACLNRWRRERDNLPASLRVSTPEPPPMEDPTENQKEWNRMAMEIHQTLMVPCPHCKRTFIMDRVALHVKSCAKNTKKNDSPPTPVKKMPPHVPCHLCGRLFGTASIDIHIPQCLEKWERENSELPAHLRREPPQRPEFVFKENGDIDYEATQNVFWQSHMEQLVPCPKCSRTFFPDRLEKHAPTCQGQK